MGFEARRQAGLQHDPVIGILAPTYNRVEIIKIIAGMMSQSAINNRDYDSVSEARASIGRYLDFYNSRRPHTGLDRRTPDQA